MKRLASLCGLVIFTIFIVLSFQSSPKKSKGFVKGKILMTPSKEVHEYPPDLAIPDWPTIQAKLEPELMAGYIVPDIGPVSLTEKAVGQKLETFIDILPGEFGGNIRNAIQSRSIAFSFDERVLSKADAGAAFAVTHDDGPVMFLPPRAFAAFDGRHAMKVLDAVTRLRHEWEHYVEWTEAPTPEIKALFLATAPGDERPHTTDECETLFEYEERAYFAACTYAQQHLHANVSHYGDLCRLTNFDQQAAFRQHVYWILAVKGGDHDKPECHATWKSVAKRPR
jgi:hypothetical protein